MEQTYKERKEKYNELKKNYQARQIFWSIFNTDLNYLISIFQQLIYLILLKTLYSIKIISIIAYGFKVLIHFVYQNTIKYISNIVYEKKKKLYI